MTAENDCAAQVYDVLARGISVTSFGIRPVLPLSVSAVTSRQRLIRPKPDAAMFCVTYQLDVRDSRAKRTACLELTLIALCAVTPACTDTDLEQFGKTVLPAVLRGFLGEEIDAACTRAGLPLLLAVYSTV